MLQVDHSSRTAALCWIVGRFNMHYHTTLMVAFFGWRHVTLGQALLTAVQAATTHEADLAHNQLSLHSIEQRAALQGLCFQKILLRPQLHAWLRWTSCVQSANLRRIVSARVMQMCVTLGALGAAWQSAQLWCAWHWWGACAARSVAFRSRKDSISLLHRGSKYVSC